MGNPVTKRFYGGLVDILCIFREFKFLKNKDLQINILLIMNKIRNASYNFLDINRLNKLKKFILKNDNLDILGYGSFTISYTKKLKYCSS